MARELTLLLHFLGFGLLFASAAAGIVLEIQYRKTTDIGAKATIAKILRPLGLFGPIGMLVMIISGIGNMHAVGYSLMELPGWLAYKLGFFVLAVVSGITFGIKSRRRGKLLQAMVKKEAPANAQETLTKADSQTTLFYMVMWILLLIILYLSIYGRLGGQDVPIIE